MPSLSPSRPSDEGVRVPFALSCKQFAPEHIKTAQRNTQPHVKRIPAKPFQLTNTSSFHGRSRSSTRGHQQQWQGTQRSPSGSSSQGTKRRADSDALDPPYESKRARIGTPSALRSQPDTNGQNGPTKAEADSGGVPGSDLHGSSSGVIKSSILVGKSMCVYKQPCCSVLAAC